MRGNVEDYFLKAAGELSGVLLKNFRRYKFSEFEEDREAGLKPDPKKYWKAIPGSNFYLPADKIANLNIRYETPESELILDIKRLIKSMDLPKEVTVSLEPHAQCWRIHWRLVSGHDARRRSQVHQTTLVAHYTPYDEAFVQAKQHLIHGVDPWSFGAWQRSRKREASFRTPGKASGAAVVRRHPLLVCPAGSSVYGPYVHLETRRGRWTRDHALSVHKGCGKE